MLCRQASLKPHSRSPQRPTLLFAKDKIGMAISCCTSRLCTLLKCPRGGNWDGTKLHPIGVALFHMSCHIASPRKHFFPISRICPGKTTPVLMLPVVWRPAWSHIFLSQTAIKLKQICDYMRVPPYKWTYSRNYRFLNTYRLNTCTEVASLYLLKWKYDTCLK